MNKFETLLAEVGGWFKKVFKNVPSETTQALVIVNQLAPEAEIVFSLVDPEAAAVANPIINEATADLGTVASMLKNGNTANLPTFLTAIKSNLSTLLTEGHIKDPASVTKATGIVSGIIAGIQSVESLIASKAAA